MGVGHTYTCIKDNTLHSLVNHNVGTNGDGGKQVGEEERGRGESALCMSSSLTTGLRGPRLT